MTGAQPPRVAVLADWWWPTTVGGAERSARAAAMRLARSAEVAVFVPATTDHTYADGPLTVHAVRRPFGRDLHAATRMRRGLEFLTAWALPLVASPLIRRLRDFRPDAVVATNVSRTGPWLVRWARRDGVRFVRVFHDLSDTCWRRSRLRNGQNCTTICGECRIKTGIMRGAAPADTVSVCVSGFVQDEVVRSGLTTPAASLVGYPLRGRPDGTPVRQLPRTGPVTVGYIGRISSEKGIESAIRTAAACRRLTGRPVSMLVAGEGQPDYVRQLAQLAAAEGVEVRFPGHLDVDSFCQQVAVALIPSRWMEPFGRVAVEVGSSGTPMLLSPVGGLPEAAAVSGGTYAFADFRDPQRAALALGELLDGTAPGEMSPTTPHSRSVDQAVEEAVRQVLAGPVASRVGEAP